MTIFYFLFGDNQAKLFIGISLLKFDGHIAKLNFITF